VGLPEVIQIWARARWLAPETNFISGRQAYIERSDARKAMPPISLMDGCLVDLS
jgi:hypothetical protein